MASQSQHFEYAQRPFDDGKWLFYKWSTLIHTQKYTNTSLVLHTFDGHRLRMGCLQQFQESFSRFIRRQLNPLIYCSRIGTTCIIFWTVSNVNKRRHVACVHKWRLCKCCILLACLRKTLLTRRTKKNNKFDAENVVKVYIYNGRRETICKCTVLKWPHFINMSALMCYLQASCL